MRETIKKYAIATSLVLAIIAVLATAEALDIWTALSVASVYVVGCWANRNRHLFKDEEA